jgi:hypothetical protein
VSLVAENAFDQVLRPAAHPLHLFIVIEFHCEQVHVRQ